MKALVLAAGFGTRLRPLTNQWPKPLCPFMGIPLLDLAAWQIRQSGLSDVAVNTHYLAPRISEHLQQSPVWQPLRLRLDHEPTIRGTGGPLFPLRDWIPDGGSLLIYNGDIIADSELTSIIQQHEQAQADATMILLADELPGKNPVLVDDQGLIVGFGETSRTDLSRHTFTGIHMVSRDFVRSIPADVPWSILETYQQRIAEGYCIRASVLPPSSFWHDLGTPQSLWQAHLDLGRRWGTSFDAHLGLRDIMTAYRQTKIVFDEKTHSFYRPAAFDPTSLNKLTMTESVALSHHCQINSEVNLDQCLVLDDVTKLEGAYSRCVISQNHCINF
jgi:mannose-1-phosphate guanylyltransferase